MCDRDGSLIFVANPFTVHMVDPEAKHVSTLWSEHPKLPNPALCGTSQTKGNFNVAAVGLNRHGHLVVASTMPRSYLKQLGISAEAIEAASTRRNLEQCKAFGVAHESWHFWQNRDVSLKPVHEPEP